MADRVHGGGPNGRRLLILGASAQAVCGLDEAHVREADRRGEPPHRQQLHRSRRAQPRAAERGRSAAEPRGAALRRPEDGRTAPRGQLQHHRDARQHEPELQQRRRDLGPVAGSQPVGATGKRLRGRLHRVAQAAGTAADHARHHGARPEDQGVRRGGRKRARLHLDAAAPARPADPLRHRHRQLHRHHPGGARPDAGRAAADAIGRPRLRRRPLRRDRPRLLAGAARHARAHRQRRERLARPARPRPHPRSGQPERCARAPSSPRTTPTAPPPKPCACCARTSSSSASTATSSRC